jgi:hypothetical protein
MINFQVTLVGTGANPLIAAGLPPKYASWMVIQDNAGASVRMGGSTVSSSSGIVINTSGGSVTGTFNFPRGCCLNNVFLAGTAGNIIDVAYEPSA